MLTPPAAPTIVLPLVYCPADEMLFEVGPEICCSDELSHYCCYGNYAAGSNAILKLVIAVNAELSKVSL